MDTTLLFESFVVFYLLEIMVLLAVAVWYYQEPKKIPLKKAVKQPTMPTASQIIKMRKLTEQLKRYN